MQLSSACAHGVLALACLAATLGIGQARKRYSEADQPALFCALLGMLLPALAAASGALRYGFDPSWHTAQLWLSQASAFLGLPLLGAAALALGSRWAWSRPNWGRVLLGLCAFFELFRQLDQLEHYQLLLNLASALLILYAGARQWPRRAPAFAAVGAVGLFLAAERLTASQGFTELSGYLLAPAYLLLSYLLLALPGSNPRESR